MSEHLLFVDFETRCDLDIKTVGGKKYARYCEPLLLAYALDDEPPQLWDWTRQGSELPQSLVDRLQQADWLVAHNAAFDRTVWEWHVDYQAKPLRWQDTMVLAYAAGLPGSLASLGEYLGLPADTAKDKDGKRLIKKFCGSAVPPSAGGLFDDLDDDWERFCRYCQQDVVALREVYRRLPKYNATQLWDDWELDYQTNDYGVPIDLALVQGAVTACQQAATAAAAHCAQLTDGLQPTQTAAIQQWLAAHGVEAADLSKQTVEQLLAGQLPAVCREVLELRQQSAKTSTKKLQTMLDAVEEDGCIRGTLQFYGASHTGRWAGRLLQTQNLPRPTLSETELDAAIQHFTAGDAFDTYGTATADTASSCLRACISSSSPAGFTICDYSSIENRVLAWYAGEQWKLEAFKEGRDLYVETYNRTFGANITKKDKKERQIGKIMELALGYQGSVGSFVNFAQLYGVDLAQLPTPPQRIPDEAEFDTHFQHTLSRPTFFKIRQLVLGWRAAHPATRRFWDQVAHLRDGHGLHFSMAGDTLLVQLPSGRYLVYPQYDKATQTCFGQIPGHVAYGRIHVGSNVLLNNIVQGTARDLLAHALQGCARQGWHVCFHVHDEIVVEGCPSVAALQGVMCTLPAWADGLPIAAAGEQSLRYTK